MGFTDGAFQTSFVVAVLVGVVFLASRIGGDPELFRRGMQVAIGLGMVLLVFGGTKAFIRPPDIPPAGFDTFDDSEQREELLEYAEESADRASGAGSIHIAVAVVLVAFGIALRSMRVIPAGLLFGGVLLFLLGSPPGVSGTGSDFYSVYLQAAYPGVGDASQKWDIVRFVVILLAVAILVGLAYARWERPDEDGSAALTPGPPLAPAE